MLRMISILFAIFVLFGAAPAWADTDTDVTGTDTDEVVAVVTPDTDALPEDTDLPTEPTEPTPVTPAPNPEGGIQSTEEAVDVLNQVVSAINEGNWSIAIAGILLLVVWVTRNFLWKFFPAEWTAWAAMAVAALTAFGASVLSGAAVLEGILAALVGFLSGLGAAEMWSPSQPEEPPV